MNGLGQFSSPEWKRSRSFIRSMNGWMNGAGRRSVTNPKWISSDEMIQKEMKHLD
jgi:hypothetical protein